ncbi:hypothetical protein QE152_g6190 [Popillia japonica]|uniref:Uncharacterized protein n=1 Tax=Popillia japonica TaxID=7064 RepID=A0AAW1MJW2_POPJA
MRDKRTESLKINNKEEVRISKKNEATKATSKQFKPPRKLDVEGDIRGNWNKFKQAYQIFITTTNRKNTEKEIKAAIFLHLIGEEAVDLFNTFNLTADEKKEERRPKRK